MTVAATTASVAAISSLAAYINAKYHIGQDLRALKFKKGAEKNYTELGMSATSCHNQIGRSWSEQGLCIGGSGEDLRLGVSRASIPH